MTPWIVYSVAELEQAFATIPDGGRIELAPGAYARTELSGRAFVTGVTITSAVTDDRAVFTDRLILQDVSGVSLEALEVEAAQIATHRNYPRLKVKDSTDVVITDVRIEGHIASTDEGQDPFSAGTKRLDPIAGYGQDTGLNVNSSTNVTITGVELSDLRLGISLSNVHDVTVRDTDIHTVREGININDARGVLIEDSVFRNFTPWVSGSKKNNDHPDMIQFYGANSTFGVHDLTIRNNVFRQDAGDLQTQTIFGQRSAGPNPDITLTNFDIIGNTIINGHLHGISISDVDGVRILDNVLLPKPDLSDMPDQVDRPTILSVRNTDVEIAGNTLLPFSNSRDMKIDNSTDVTVADDNIILSYEPASPLFWRKVLDQVEAGTWEHGGADQDHAALDIGTDARPDDRADDGQTDIGTDAPPIDQTVVIQAARDAGWLVKTVNPAGDILNPGSDPTVLVGGEGDDWLRGRGQDTIMFGGDGADRFVFDFRNPDSAARHVVADLDWAENDYLRILTPDGGHFVRSQDQLETLIETGWLSAAARADGTGQLLHVGGRPDQQIDLAFTVTADLLDWIG